MTNLIPKAFIQDVIARTDIVAIISARVELKKRGDTHTACCPFHHEKTPSFTVSQSKQFYYCFGCGAHGNVISFLMEYDHLPFVEAVTDLAQQLGLTVPTDSNDTANLSENAALYDAMQRAQVTYENALKTSPETITYLKNRGLTGKIAKNFAIGYAPNAWDFLLKQSKAHKALCTAGMLIEKSPGHYYDRFRHRVLFPIRDTRGRTIGFGGRTMTNETPKYLNSPETPIFHKHQTLYGLYEACQHERQLKRALVVEGYMDVISLAEHGIHYSVATLGTALNIKHIQLLLRYTNDIVFCFDGDAAGQKAAWKALTICLPLLRDGLHFRFLFLTNKEDPDSLVQKIGHDAFEKLIDASTPLSDVFFNELVTQHDIHNIAGKAAFGKAATDLINTMPEGIYKNLLLDQLAQKLSLNRDKLSQPPVQTPIKKHATEPLTRFNPATVAIQLLLQQPSLADTINIDFPLNHSPETILLAKLIPLFKSNPHLTVGELLTETQDNAERTSIAAIANLPLHIPETGQATEFQDAIKKLASLNLEQEVSALIEKAKQLPLNEAERTRLKTLLTRKHQAHSEARPDGCA